MSKIRDYKNHLIITGYKMVINFFSVMPLKKNYVIFESFHGRQISDNPRAIYEYIRSDYPNQYHLIWSIDRRCKKLLKNQNYKTVKRLSLRWCYYMAVSKYWVINARLPLWLPKRKGTIFLQTWHGTPLKKLGLDIEQVRMPGTDTGRYRENFMKSSSRWDYLISPNAYSTKIFKRAFGYNGNLLECGYPRNDYLINNNNDEYINKIKKDLNISGDKKIILYAPTWRDDEFYSKGNYRFEIQLDLKNMKKELSDDYIIILRMHYLIASKIDISEYEGFVMDYSNYDDIRDLYLISDMLITDYSSVFFDYAVLKRPIIFYMYDLDKYKNQLRGFYIEDVSELPGKIVTSYKDLEKVIRETSFSNVFNDNFNKVFCSLEDGKASERVFNSVFKNR